MKTIKRASGSISKFLHFVKFPALMVLMLFGILIGGSERPKPGLPVEATDAKLGAIEMPIPQLAVSMGHFGQGSGQMERPQSEFELTDIYCGSSVPEIGGNGTPRTNPIIPNLPSPVLSDYDIGGQSTPRTDPRPYDNWPENYKS